MKVVKDEIQTTTIMKRIKIKDLVDHNMKK